jgi:hypothetical protein
MHGAKTGDIPTCHQQRNALHEMDGNKVGAAIMAVVGATLLPLSLTIAMAMKTQKCQSAKTQPPARKAPADTSPSGADHRRFIEP